MWEKNVKENVRKMSKRFVKTVEKCVTNTKNFSIKCVGKCKRKYVEKVQEMVKRKKKKKQCVKNVKEMWKMFKKCKKKKIVKDVKRNVWKMSQNIVKTVETCVENIFKNVPENVWNMCEKCLQSVKKISKKCVKRRFCKYMFFLVGNDESCSPSVWGLHLQYSKVFWNVIMKFPQRKRVDLKDKLLLIGKVKDDFKDCDT